MAGTAATVFLMDDEAVQHKVEFLWAKLKY